MQLTLTTTTTGALVELGCNQAALRRLRKSAGFTQAGFARMVGVSRQWYSGLERGRRNPSLRLASRIAERLQVDLAAFLYGPVVSQGNRSASLDAAGVPDGRETDAAEAYAQLGYSAEDVADALADDPMFADLSRRYAVQRFADLRGARLREVLAALEVLDEVRDEDAATNAERSAHCAPSGQARGRADPRVADDHPPHAVPAAARGADHRSRKE